MAFTKKGEKRPEGAGRQKGSKNKRKTLLEICEENNLDVFASLVESASKATGDKKDQLLFGLMPYLHPKQKEAHITHDLGQSFEEKTGLKERRAEILSKVLKK